MATQKSSFWLTPKGLAALGLIAAASYFLLIEHRGQHEDESDQDAYQRGLEEGRRENEHRHHH